MSSLIRTFTGVSDAQIEAVAWEMHPRWVAGRYYSLDSPPFAVATSSPASSRSAGLLRAHLIPVPPGGSIDRLVVPDITVAASAGKLARLGLYEYDYDTGRPGALIVDGGTVAVDSTGDKSVTVDVTPTSRLVVVAEIHEEAFTSPAWTSTAQNILGASTPSGNSATAWTKVMAFGALPDPFPADASVTAGTTMKLVVRAA